MMAEGINNTNGHNNDHLSGNEYEILKQGSISNVQVGFISGFLSECPEAVLSVHKFLQTNYSKSNQQQQIVQPVNSTPKRGYPLDESGSSINNGRGRRSYPQKGIDNNAHMQLQYVQQEVNLQPQQPSSSTSSGERQHQVINQASTNRKRISFNQLKHAVSSNLLCFFIEFTSDADRHSIPTALHASDFILKELQSKDVLINKFTLVGWSGEKLKLGVNNKEDYATLVGSDEWPTNINGIDIGCRSLPSAEDIPLGEKRKRRRPRKHLSSNLFELRDQDFPPLTTSGNHSKKQWNIEQPRMTR
ncbi:unnamed protein product, partial [Rotaria magnacalcarata]